jgi:hypothetical protein
MWSFVSRGLDVLKKDLGEFQTTVRDDTHDAVDHVQDNVSKTIDKVQSGVSTTIETIGKSVDGEDFEETLLKLGELFRFRRAIC